MTAPLARKPLSNIEYLLSEIRVHRHMRPSGKTTSTRSASR